MEQPLSEMSQTPRQASPAVDPTAAIAFHEKMAVSIGQNEARVQGLTEDVHDLGKRVGGLESEMRRGFSDVASQVALVATEFRAQNAALSQEAIRLAAPKGIQWPMVAVVLTGVGMVVLWAGNVVGKDISALARENSQAGERLTVLSNRLHEQSIIGAKQSGAQERDAYWIDKQNERLQSEIDILRTAAKNATP